MKLDVRSRAESQRLAEAGDREGLRGLIESWEVVAPNAGRRWPVSLVDVLIARAFRPAGVRATCCRPAASSGLEEEAGRIEPVVAGLRWIAGQQQERRRHSAGRRRRIERHAGVLAALFMPR